MTIPLLYHTHYSHHLDDLPFWLDLADQQGDPILELGCGTGRVLIPLVKAGQRAFGLDNDFAMLSLLKNNLAGECGPEFSHRTPIFLADLSHFHLGTLFPLILVPCNTWSTLDPAARQRSLQRISAHLSSNGLFVASVPNPVLLVELPAGSEAEFEESFDHPLTNNPVQVSSSWKRDSVHFTVSWYYDHLLPDGTTERFMMDAAHHLSTTENYMDELYAAGMQLRATWGDFDSSAYGPDSAHLILVASKY
jgi:SAM-dependent methyltransferase